MWKLIVASIAFAGLVLFILTKSGGNIDLSGESHGIASHEAAPAAVDAASAPAAASGASR